MELQQQHVEANEALDRAYQKVNVLSSEAKHKSLKHLETAESLGKGWTTEQKGLMYGLGIVGGMFGGPIGGDENILKRRVFSHFESSRLNVRSAYIIGSIMIIRESRRVSMLELASS